MDDDFHADWDEHEQIFHNNVREQIIFLLLFLTLYILSSILLDRYKRKTGEDYCSYDDDEITIHRISTWLCAFSLAVSIGAVLLLPLSIVSNEVLVNYPKSYYVKWLNSSLIQGLWNYVFLFSNLSVFICLPFAYFFVESEGFLGHRKRLRARFNETMIIMTFLIIVFLGLSCVMSAIINKEKLNWFPILDVRRYVNFCYSCTSFLGVLILLVCTPLGFVHLFDLVGQYLVKPQFIQDLQEEYSACALEQLCLNRRLKRVESTKKYFLSPSPMSIGTSTLKDEYELPQSFFNLRNGELQNNLDKRLTEIAARKLFLDKQRNTSWLRRNIVYPLAMLLLIGLTVFAVLLVIQNSVFLLIGIKALPCSTEQFTLGTSSLSKLGPLGAALEIIMIVYFIATSTIGLYTAPYMEYVRPKVGNTSFTLIIGNCALILIISSALPLLSKILGITNFDLLGDFASIQWLGNLKIVLLYNILFAAVSSSCVVNKFTVKVRRELYARLMENYELLTNYVSYLN